MKVPATLKWIGLALLGILVAAAVSLAASHLVSRQIGLASEPISAGEALAPRSHARPERRRVRRDDGGAQRPRPSERREAERAAPTTPQAPAVEEPDGGAVGEPGGGETGGERETDD
jgi:hypothetical protein